MKHLTALVVALLWITPAHAQLVEPNEIGVRMGHAHPGMKDVEAHTQFWVSVMCGTPVELAEGLVPE